MIGNVLAKRYAKAFLELLREDEIEAVRKDFDTLQSLMQSSTELRKLFLSPVFKPEEKKGVLKLLSERAGFSKESQRLFELLIEKERLKYFKEIKTFFEAFLYERKNKVKAYVISSDIFPPSYKAELIKSLKKITKKEIDLNIKTDHSLIGGLVVRIGDVIYDGSIKGQLINIKKGLLEGSSKD